MCENAPVSVLNRKAYLMAAAGLLHDLGKVLEPSKVSLGEAELRLEQLICPTIGMFYGQRICLIVRT